MDATFCMLATKSNILKNNSQYVSVIQTGRRLCLTHLSSVVEHGEHQFVFVLFRFGEFDMASVCVQQLVHECDHLLNRKTQIIN